MFFLKLYQNRVGKWFDAWKDLLWRFSLTFGIAFYKLCITNIWALILLFIFNQIRFLKQIKYGLFVINLSSYNQFRNIVNYKLKEFELNNLIKLMWNDFILSLNTLYFHIFRYKLNKDYFLFTNIFHMHQTL